MKNLNEKPIPKLSDALQIHPKLEQTYKLFLKSGVEHFPNKKFVVSILARNVADVFENNIQSIISALEEAKDYRIIIYENDSEDNTVELIKDLAKNNDKILLHTETHNRKQYGPVRDPERTNNLAEYRNYNLSIIKEQFSDFDYTIVCDIDFQEFYITSLLHSVGVIEETQSDAVCGVSYCFKNFSGQYILWNYDSWAYRQGWWHDLSYSGNGQYHPFNDPMCWYNFCVLPLGSDPYSVNSGFGGMAIYKTSSYTQGEYAGGDCEHVNFHLSLAQKNSNFLLTCNPSQVMLMRDN